MIGFLGGCCSSTSGYPRRILFVCIWLSKTDFAASAHAKKLFTQCKVADSFTKLFAYLGWLVNISKMITQRTKGQGVG